MDSCFFFSYHDDAVCNSLLSAEQSLDSFRRSLRSLGPEKKLKVEIKTYGSRSFTVAAPTKWKSLPLELRT